MAHIYKKNLLMGLLKAKAGFTLVEVIMVTVIIAILAAFAVPNFMDWLPNMRLKAAARGLYSNLQQAKLRAVKEGNCIGVKFTTKNYNANDSTGGGSYLLFIDDGSGGGVACNALQDGNESEITSYSVAKGIFIVNASIGSSSSLCFTPTAVLCGSQYGNIQLRNHKSKWFRVTVSAAGSASLEKSNDGTAWSD